MYITNRRIYRTATGELVEHNDPTAAFLAFPAGEELSDEEAARFGVLELDAKRAGRPLDKLGARPADKAVPKTTDKAPKTTTTKETPA